MTDDIRQLQNLKAEIEDVKKSLKGINVTVDINIKEGMEKQLQNLMAQYNSLVEKISQAEGRIMLSVQKINNATQQIVSAQQNVTNAATGNGNSSNAAGTNSQTAGIEAQAKAYDELKSKIEAINGTREELIERMVNEMNEIRRLNAEIKAINKSQETSGRMSDTAKQKLINLNNELITHKTALSEVRQAINNNAKLDNAAASSMDGLSQSLSRMRIVYRGLTEEERESPFGKELLASIQQADAKIKELDASIGNH